MKPTNKQLLAVLIVCSFASLSWAKAYVFTYKMNGETFEYKQESDSKDEAYEKAAKSCYNHFKAGKKLSESKGLDIIDVCANPKTNMAQL